MCRRYRNAASAATFASSPNATNACAVVSNVEHSVHRVPCGTPHVALVDPYDDATMTSVVDVAF